MRLIDAEVLQKNIARHRTMAMSGAHEETEAAMACYNPSSFMAGLDYGMELANKLVFNAPTIEAVPVVHGSWESYPSELYRRCSVCKREYYKLINHFAGNFCPNCGARMDGKKVE